MGIAGSRVGIAGGSIAGCATAIALGRLGCEIQVFQQSRDLPRDRGAGIVIPMALHESLVELGYLPGEYPVCRYRRRWWVLADGEPSGQRVWSHAIDAVTNNWALLWGALRAGVADGAYHAGQAVRAVVQSADGAKIEFANGRSEAFDVVIGADGYNSTVRGVLHLNPQPEMADYVLWRGDFEESRVGDRAVLDRADAEQASYTVPFAGGHGVLYVIPGSDGRTDPGHRRVNWGIYTRVPPSLDQAGAPALSYGVVSRAAHQFLRDILGREFPRELADLIRLTPKEKIWIQPIYDKVVTHYSEGRVLLIGDAGSVTRPHTGSGATKALQDALALSRHAAEHDDWESAIAAYDADRSAVGRTLAEMGRRLGRAQVESTPDWAAMTPEDFEAWTTATLSGDSLYLLGSNHDRGR